MYRFTIQTTDAFASTSTVQVRAKTPEEAIQLLKKEGLKAALSDIATANKEGFFTQFLESDLVGNLFRVPKAEILRLIKMMGHSLSRGRSLKLTLDFIGENEDHRGLKKVIEGLQQRMKKPFTSQVELFSSYPHYFDEEFLGIVEAGESSSNLGQYLTDYVEEKKKQMQLTETFRTVLIKRLTTLAMVIVVAIIVVAFVIPQFEALFGENLDIPWAMEVLLRLSDSFQRFGFWIILVFALSIIGFYYALNRFSEFKFWWHHRLLYFPLLGKTLRTYYTAQFAYLLSTLLTKNVDLLKAMNIIIRQSGNVCLQGSYKQLTKDMQGGDDLFTAIVKQDQAGQAYLIPSIVQAAKVGGATASLGHTLMEVRHDLDELFTNRLNRAIKVFSFVFYTFIIFCAVFIAYGIGKALMAFYENAQQLI